MDLVLTVGSTILGAFTLVGIIAVGNKKTWGFLYFCVVEVAWVVYGVITSQIGLSISSAVFLVINFRNWLKWRREEPKPPGSPKEEATISKVV